MKKFLCLFLSLMMLSGCTSNEKDVAEESIVTSAIVTENTEITSEEMTIPEITTTPETVTNTEKMTTAKTTTTKKTTTKRTTTKRTTTTKKTTTKRTTTKRTTTSKITTSKPVTTQTVTIPQTTTVTVEITTTQAPVQPSNDYLSEVVRLVNIERANERLSPLSMTNSLNNAADKRAREIISVLDHTRPDGSSCFTVFEEYGINYSYAGENIAAGQHSPEEVVTAWMNSPGHRKNILSPDFGHIGIGYIYSPDNPYKSYWAQLFTD